MALSHKQFYEFYFKSYRKKNKYISYKIIQRKIHIKWKIYEYNQKNNEEILDNKNSKVVWKDELYEVKYY